MLLNLTNHPSQNWPENQRNKALQLFGTIDDMPFPAIDPEATTDQIRLLAEQYFIKIRQIAAKQSLTVHIMGEFTFCYMLIQMLQSNGIPCVASTTERVSEKIDGKIVSQFTFVQFRGYS